MASKLYMRMCTAFLAIIFFEQIYTTALVNVFEFNFLLRDETLSIIKFIKVWAIELSEGYCENYIQYLQHQSTTSMQCSK